MAEQNVTPNPAGDERSWSDDTPEELLEQAQANAQALAIATLAFLSKRGISPEEWAESVGRSLSVSWDDPEPWEAGEFLDAMLTNLRSLGATVVSSSLQPDRAEATVRNFPDPELCSLFGVDLKVAACINDLPAPIAAERSLRWSWSRRGDETHIEVSRATALADGPRS